MADRKRTRPPDWNDLRLFASLAKNKTLSATARALGVNHSTVARRLVHLERHLGCELFDRRLEGYVINASGSAVLTHAAAMSAEASEVHRLFDGGKSLSGSVRITATRALSESIIAPQIAGLAASLPDVTIELLAEERSLSLPRREADIAIRLARPTRGEKLVARKLGLMNWRLYATPEFLQTYEPSAFVFVGYEEEMREVPESRILLEYAATRRFAFRSNSLLAQREAAVAGLGVAFLPAYLTHDRPLVEADTITATREVWMLMRQELGEVERVRRTADFLVELFKRKKERLLGDDRQVAAEKGGYHVRDHD